MLNEIFIIKENALSPILTKSIEQVMPDVHIIYLSGNSDIIQTESSYINVSDLNTDGLAKQMIKAGHSGICFVLTSSQLVIHDFRKFLPPISDLRKFYCGVTREYMHVGEHSHVTGYDELGLNFRALSDRVRFINLDMVDQPKSRRRLIMPLTMRYGGDPLVSAIFDGGNLVKCSQDAMQSRILDFGREMLNPNISVEECYAYPFDIYGNIAEQVREQIPSDVFDTIMKNANRTRWISPLRDILI